ncbi:molybdopterin-dependent oxidoreductase [Promineifilum sp.]|uniref:molybdopterin-dependent oxidoreductase n=1 Tax=Promineifilum sp. TaxID=2664178 RepID=UPI0035AE565B
MKLPWVNLLLLFLLLAQAITGYFGFTNGREAAAWLLWLHGIIAYALILLVFLKANIILDAWRRKKRWTGRRVGFLVTLALLGLTLLLGLLWTFNGPLYLGGFSLVSLHIYVAVPLMLLMLWHAWHMRFIRRVEGATGRRLFLGGLAATGAGLLLWLIVGRAKAWAGLAGAARRFTGSYETGSFGGDFPVVSWIADRPPPVDVTAWRLRVEGAVERPLSLSYADLTQGPQRELVAALDCTGGWYSVQRWQGVRVGELLAQAGLSDQAASVTFVSVSGYRRRFALPAAQGYLLALGVIPGSEPDQPGAFQPLSHGHGAPARLVAPGERGMEWVKWVTIIRVNESGPYVQSPLPLQ